MPKPLKRRKRPLYLTPDGVPIHVDWAQFAVGASIFIPCIDTQEARKQLRMQGVRMGMEFEHEVRIEGGKYGIRAWRTV